MTSPDQDAQDDQRQEGQERMVFRDKRRLDPETGAVRDVVTPPESSAPATEGQPEEGDQRVGELTEALQRVTAEYANYRKRVERDRVAVVELATAGLLADLLPLLDDVDRAREHDDLTGTFKGVGEGLEAVSARLGLERYGAAGDPFDPFVHEAVMQAEPDPSATVSTVAQVFRVGARVGGRILRAAQVTVSDPETSESQPGTSEGESVEEPEQVREG